MPTPLDRATNQRAPFFAFAALVTGVAAWSIWGQDLFPSADPTGGYMWPGARDHCLVYTFTDPETWTHEQCVTWLNKRNLHPSPLATTAELLERIKANMRVDRERRGGQ